jgi:hypothetical protein
MTLSVHWQGADDNVAAVQIASAETGFFRADAGEVVNALLLLVRGMSRTSETGHGSSRLVWVHIFGQVEC